jgi:hypothetical protein
MEYNQASVGVGASVLPERFRAREVPSGREPVGSFAFEGRLGA